MEVLLVHPLDDDSQGPRWRRLVRGKVREGTLITLGTMQARVERCHEDGERDLRCPGDCSVLALADAIGHMPLPPYIRRDDTPGDRERYQTVFGDIPGSVAAPTASLHLTPELLQRLEQRGVATAQVELRIGPGTCQPLDDEHVDAFRMHAEWCHCPAETAAAIHATRARGGTVLALGTTVVRTLETAARLGATDGSFQGWSSIFLRPPERLLWVDRLLTNFHLPKSTLLMLVACLCGRERLFQAYHHALSQGYRFFSYGDAMLVNNDRPPTEAPPSTTPAT